MSVRETIRVAHEFDADKYLLMLQAEYNAIKHPSQPEAFLVDSLPFYKPRRADHGVYVLGFNLVPLPGVLIDSLADHPELVPDDVEVLWLIEQEVFLETTVGEQRNR